MKSAVSCLLSTLLLVGAAHAKQTCEPAQAFAIWQSTNQRLQSWLGREVAQPRIVLYRDAQDLPGNAHDLVLAYYDAVNATLHVPCQDADGATLEVAIRHEATHHYLAQAFGVIPRWLGEGMASYMEAGALTEGNATEHLNEKRLNEFVDMLKWGKAPTLAQMLTHKPAASQLSQYYAAYWALVFALIHHPDPAIQADRRRLLRNLLENPQEGTAAINQQLIDGVLREQPDSHKWEMQWRRQIWALR